MMRLIEGLRFLVEAVAILGLFSVSVIQILAGKIPVFSSSSSINLILGAIYGTKISTCF
ncbi:hypothetical protein [Streptococcus oralis]|uniref:hypothetical protein n=1 Tax=Streptococcus oralis TaxID=1303 RepID=UPI001EFE8BD2|nr:hypothetical protein [Streptococcus oralis]